MDRWTTFTAACGTRGGHSLRQHGFGFGTNEWCRLPPFTRTYTSDATTSVTPSCRWLSTGRLKKRSRALIVGLPLMYRWATRARPTVHLQFLGDLRCPADPSAGGVRPRRAGRRAVTA